VVLFATPLRADQLAARGHAGELRQRRRLPHRRQQLDVEGDAQQRGRLRAIGDGGQDAVRRHPGRDGQLYARVQAVEQAATEHCEQHGDAGQAERESAISAVPCPPNHAATSVTRVRATPSRDA